MNKLIGMFNMDKVKQMIKDCPKDEIVILLSHYSINKPEYSEEESINNYEFDDFDELSDELNCFVSVNDYDDLICDPHNIMD